MQLGVPKEIKAQEFRVGMTPAGVRELVSAGHTVLTESGAGDAIGLTDDLYRAAGASVVETADIVSLHIPAAAETKGLFGADLLGRMKQGAIFINTARGDVVDAAALGDAIEKRGLRVGLDVYPDEPSGGAAEWTSELASHPSVVGTHHIGASTDQAQAAIAAGVVEIIEAYGQGEILNCVNLEERPLGTCTLHVRHYDRVGVLASVLAELRGHDLNVKQMENRVFEGSNAAVAIIHVAGTVDDELLDIISGLENVIHATRVGAN